MKWMFKIAGLVHSWLKLTIKAETFLENQKDSFAHPFCREIADWLLIATFFGSTPSATTKNRPELQFSSSSIQLFNLSRTVFGLVDCNWSKTITHPGCLDNLSWMFSIKTLHCSSNAPSLKEPLCMHSSKSVFDISSFAAADFNEMRNEDSQSVCKNNVTLEIGNWSLDCCVVFKWLMNWFAKTVFPLQDGPWINNFLTFCAENAVSWALYLSINISNSLFLSINRWFGNGGNTSTSMHLFLYAW